MVAIFTPYKLAYIDDDDGPSELVDRFIDGLFGIDLIVSFFTAYFDEH